MDNKTKLEYALKLKRLHEIMVIKENLYFAHQNANYNRAAYHIDKIVDKHLEEHIINTVDGTISLTNHENKLDKIMSTTLTNQRKRVLKKTNRYIDKAVENNINTYSNFLKNRINKESISLANKIEQEAKKKQYKHLTDTETKKILQEKFSNHGRRRAKNILRDALHTNQSNISWINGIQQGYKYKIWMNGAGKGRVRLWHKAKKIQPVHMDEFFDIYGSYHATMMYPGDLNGGAENVANCRCWLNYTNQKPQELKTRGTFTISNNVELQPTDKPKTKTESIPIKQETIAPGPKPPKPKFTEKVKTRIKKLENNVKQGFKNIKFNIKYRVVLKLKREFHDYTNQFKKNYKETQKNLKELYKTPKDLSIDEKRAIKRWGNDSKPLVEYLRYLSKYFRNNYFEEYHLNLINAISKYDNIKVKTILHRRVSGDFFIVDVGEVGTFDTPTSTTFNSIDNKDYGDFHITILAPESSNGAYIEELMEGNSRNNHLNEWLLPKDTEYITLVKDYETKEAIILLQ